MNSILFASLFLLFWGPFAEAKSLRCDSVNALEALQISLNFQPNEKTGAIALYYLGTEPATQMMKGQFRVQQMEKSALLQSEIVGKFNYQVKLLMPKEYRAKNLLTVKMKLSRSSTEPIFTSLSCRQIQKK